MSDDQVFDQSTQPIDLHMTKLGTYMEEDKKKTFSIDSILGREELEDSRTEETSQCSPLVHGSFLASASTFINGKLYSS